MTRPQLTWNPLSAPIQQEFHEAAAGEQMTKPFSAEEAQHFSDAIVELKLTERMLRAKALMLEGKGDEAIQLVKEVSEDTRRLIRIYRPNEDK